MKILVIGGTGTIGRLVVAELLQQPVSIRVLISSPEQAALFPNGVETVVGHLEQPATLPKAFNDIDTVALLNQRCPTEGAQGQYAIAAAQRAGVRKMVYLSHYNARQMPHMKTRVTVENVLMQTGMAFVMICPTLIYQHDLAIGTQIASYTLPIQFINDNGINRVDARDVADATLKALLTDDLNGQSIPVVGLQTNEAPQLNHSLSAPFTTPTRTSIADQSPATWLIDDWRKTYLFMLQEGQNVSSEAVALCTDVLGRTPRSYADFLADYAPAFQHSLELV